MLASSNNKLTVLKEKKTRIVIRACMGSIVSSVSIVSKVSICIISNEDMIVG